MFPDILAAFALFAVVTSITPGPNTLMLLASGVNFGFRSTMPAMFGVVIGFVVLLLAVGAGLGSLLSAWPTLYTVLKIAGGLYLLYFAWRIANAGPLSDEGAGHTKPLGFVAAAGFQWVNPKAWVMAVTAMATYTSATEYWPSMVLIAALFGLVGLPAMALWAGLGILLRRWLTDPARLRVFNIAMAVLLVVSLWPLLR
jgi:threonine/homoserine/homoserine lactone efflux protein